MLKKNTRKRLLAGALATIMALTMCPSWALADDEDITTLPAPEGQMSVVDSTPAEDTIQKTPDAEPQGQPELQDPAQAPSGGTLADGSYSKGKVYPKIELTLPTDAEITREGYTFDGWYDEANNKLYQTGNLMPNKDLKLTAHWTKNTPDPDPEPEKYPAMYFILMPTLGTPTSGAS